MEYRNSVHTFEKLTWVFPAAYTAVVVLVMGKLGLTIAIALSLPVLLYWGLYLSEDIIFPLYLLVVASTAQIPVDLHHLVSYGFSVFVMVFWFSKHFYFNKSFVMPDRNLLYFIFAVLSLDFISSLFSDYFAQSLFLTFRQFIFFFIIYMYYDWLKNEKRLKILSKTLIILGVLMSLSVLIEFLQSGFMLFTADDKSPVRYAGILLGANQNHLGMFLSYSAPFAISFSLHNTKIKNRIIYSLFSLIILAALFLTFSRASWLAVGLSTTVLLMTSMIGRRIFLGTLLCVLTIIIFSQTVQDLFLLFIRIDSGLSFRDVIWSSAYKIFSDNPFLGAGPGTFKNFVFTNSGVSPGSFLAEIIIMAKTHAHNLYLTKAAELGIGGVMLCIGVFWLFISKYISSFPNKFLLEENAILYACGAAVVGAFGRSFFEGNGIFTEGWLSIDIYFWLVMIITTRFSQLNQLNVKDKIFSIE